MEENNKPKRIHTVLFEFGKACAEDGKVTLGDLRKVEDELKALVKQMVYNMDYLGLKITTKSYIGDLD